jgi:plastocyanin
MTCTASIRRHASRARPAPAPHTRAAPLAVVTALALGLAISIALLALAPAARATAGFDPNSPDIQHLQFQYGPLNISPGQNLILLGPNLQKPSQDGYIIRMKPDLKRPDGTVPRVDVLHLHHGVWLNASRQDATSPGLPERFFASGEEKTIFRLPDGYGYPVKASDSWLLNYMVHNLTSVADTVYITYDIDFVPADSALGKTIKPARPIWLDVRNGEAYPVFDVHRGTGSGGRFTYPDQARAPYGSSAPANQWTVDRPGTLLATAGHVHPGGLYTDLDLVRDGATVASPASPTPNCARTTPRRTRRARSRHRSHRRGRHQRAGRQRAAGHRRGRRRHRARHPGDNRGQRNPTCPSTARGSAPIPGSVAHSVRLFRSNAQYWDPNGPVSWDLAMGATSPDWRVAVRPGDRLRISATYDTTRASWYESMGIMVVFMADDATGADPFRTPLDQTDKPTHGEMPENRHFGGAPTGLPDPAALPAGQAPGDIVNIANFSFAPGDQALSGGLNDPPAIHEGQQLRFVNQDATAQVMHSVTACRAPCNLSAGASYPLANGAIDFDSGNLGYGPTGLTAAANRNSWNTPSDLPSGTYTYFCRIHPFMHGAFRVIR